MLFRLLPLALALAAGIAPAAEAQARDTLSLSIEDAVGRALRAGDEARIAAAQVSVADAQVDVARSSGLPQLRLQGTYSHVFLNARAQAVGSIFNQPNTYNTYANLSQTFFQGGKVFAGTRAASRLRNAARLTADETRADVSLSVQTAYLQALYQRRLYEIDSTSLALSDARVAQIEELEKAGRAARYDVLTARVQRANLEPQVLQARSDAEYALLDLERLTNIPLDQPIRLTTAIDSGAATALLASLDADSGAAAERGAVRAAELTAQARHDAVSVARADLLPTISAYVQTGFQAFPRANIFPMQGGQLDVVDCPAGSTPGRVCTDQNGGWFGDRSVGVTVSWPIFDGLRVKGNIELAQAQADVADLQLAQEREQVALEVAQARANLARSRATFAAQHQNALEAGEAFHLASLRFARGLSTQLEVSDAQLALLTAQTNEARAVYDLYLASASLARALGRPIPFPPASAAAPVQTPSTTTPPRE